MGDVVVWRPGLLGWDGDLLMAKGDSWTAVHAPRLQYAKDLPPETSWWVGLDREAFRVESRKQFKERLRRSERKSGNAGVDLNA